MTGNQDDTLFSSPPSTKEELSPGMIINETYQIVSLIGRGGMGAVYRVKQIFLGKDFALKVLDLHNQSDVTVRRFQQEARTTAQLQHYNLVEVHDFGMIDGSQPYLVMDLVEGVTLSEILKKKGALSIEYVVALCTEICRGLIYAHEKGVVHRDIKPGNIMLLHADNIVSEGTVKIVDFGIAKLTQSDAGEIQELTRTGEIFGSPIYMSPEQCKGSAVDKRSDIYSLGCVIFECLTGSPPFLGDNAMSTMLKRLSEDPVSLKEGSLGREFPPILESIVRRMLEVDPDDRYQDLHAVIGDMASLQEPQASVEETPAAVVELPKQSISISRRVWIGVAVAVVSSLLTAGIDRWVVLPKILKANSEARIRQAEKDLNDAKDSKSIPIDGSTPQNSDKTLGKESMGRYPSVIFQSSPSGDKQPFLFFPLDCGRISTGKERKQPAQGRIPLPDDARIILKLNRSASVDENTLKNLTDLRFRRIDYAGKMMVTNQHIAILEKVENLEQVGLEDCNVSSLKPLYNSKTLEQLEVGGTHVPSAEILKVRHFGVLRNLTFGPVSDPFVIFDALAKSNKIVSLNYKGALLRETSGKGLTARDIAALSKLTNLRMLSIETCPQFDDKSLQQLLSLQNLHELKIKDSAITPKSISTLRKFKNLKEIFMTTTGWSKAEIQQLRTKWRVVELETREQREKNRNSKIEDGAGCLD